MAVDLSGLIMDVAADGLRIGADLVLAGLHAVYAGGAPDGLGPGGSAAGAAAAAAAGAAAAASAVGGSDAAFPPIPSARETYDYRAGAVRYRDSSGNPYWPGFSQIPGDGNVHRTIPRHPNLGGDYEQRLPLNPITGRPVYPPGSREATERPTAATVAGARG